MGRGAVSQARSFAQKGPGEVHASEGRYIYGLRPYAQRFFYSSHAERFSRQVSLFPYDRGAHFVRVFPLSLWRGAANDGVCAFEGFVGTAFRWGHPSISVFVEFRLQGFVGDLLSGIATVSIHCQQGSCYDQVDQGALVSIVVACATGVQGYVSFFVKVVYGFSHVDCLCRAKLPNEQRLNLYRYPYGGRGRGNPSAG